MKANICLLSCVCKVTGWLAVLLSFGPAIVLAAVTGLYPS